jgi:hypothetical protein
MVTWIKGIGLRSQVSGLRSQVSGLRSQERLSPAGP